MKVKFLASKRKFWPYLAWFMIVVCVFACLLLAFSLVSTIYELIRYNFEEVVAIRVAPTVSYVSFVLSFIALVCQWKQLRLLLHDISNEVNLINAEIEKRLVIKTIICFFAVLIFILLDVANTCKIMMPILKYVHHSNSLNFICFGCNFTTWNENLFQVYFFTFAILYGPSVIVITWFQVIFYCFLAMALADITKHTLAHFVPSLERGSLQNLPSLSRRFHRIRKLVDRLNQVFKKVVLFWLGSTLLTTCRNVTDFLTYILDPSKPVLDHRNTFFWMVQLKDLVLLVSLVWVASRLPDECDKVHNYLPYLSDAASMESKGGRQLLIFYQELSSRKLALKAGSCFLITKNLLLSFFGLAVTYTVVFIQFKPHLFNKLSETRANGTQMQ